MVTSPTYRALYNNHRTKFRSSAHFSIFFYRHDAAKRQTAGIKFTHRPKIRFFAQQRRLIAPIHVKLGRADGHLGPLGCAKFYINHHSGVAMRPQNIKNFHCFGKESPRRGESLDWFWKFLGAFMRLTILHWCFKFDMIRFTGYWGIAEKPCVRQLGRIFPCTL